MAQTITISNDLGLLLKTINRGHLRRIMSLRLEEVFQLIGQDLEQADVLDYLRAGVFLCGGGSRIPQIAQLAEQVLQMPVTLGKTNSISGLKSALEKPEFATAIGLVKFGSFQQRKRAAKYAAYSGVNAASSMRVGERIAVRGFRPPIRAVWRCRSRVNFRVAFPGDQDIGRLNIPMG